MMSKNKNSTSFSAFLGACGRRSPGPSGWGLIVSPPQGTLIELYGKDASATDERAELLAAAAALDFLQRESPKSRLTIVTNSSYLLCGAARWLPAWKPNGWKMRDGSEINNLDLWQELDDFCGRLSVRWIWGQEFLTRTEFLRASELAQLGQLEAEFAG